MIKIRYKPLLTGGYSIYLDIYTAGKRERKFLGLRTSKDYSKKKFISKEDFEAVENAKQKVIEFSGEHKECSENESQATPLLIEFIKMLTKDYTKQRSANLSLIKHLQQHTEKKDLPFSVITKKWINSFESYLNSHLSDTTVNVLLLTFRSFLNEALKQGYMKTNPLSEYKTIHFDKDRPFLKSSEIEALASTATTFNPDIRLSFFFSLLTGLKWEHISNLKWEQINVKKLNKKEVWTVTINGYMNHAVYVNDLCENAVAILKELTLTNDNRNEVNVSDLVESVFNRLPNKPNVNIKLRLWGAMAGIEKNVCFSMARNTFAMNHVENGVDKHQLKRLLNVNRACTVMVYERMKNKNTL